LDWLNSRYILGDMNNLVNGALLNMNDNTGRTELIARQTGSTSLLLDTVSGDAVLGDALSTINGTQIKVNDSLFDVQIQQGTNIGLDAHFLNDIYRFGKIVGGNGNHLTINDTTQITQITDGTDPALQFDLNALTYGIGDLNAVAAGFALLIDSTNGNFSLGDQVANNTLITGDSATQKIGLWAPLGLDINGTPGFTGTVTPVTTITVVGGIVTNVA
jgi:hypothetical protein